MSNDLLYIGIIAFIFLIIIGLYLSQETKLNISQKNNILMENFTPKVSSTTAQKKDANNYINGDYQKIMLQKKKRNVKRIMMMIFLLLLLNLLKINVPHLKKLIVMNQLETLNVILVVIY